MITINEIAKICDVSAMTVSRVVNKKDAGKVSPKTRDNILKVVKKYNYRPNAGVRALRTGRTHIVGFITDVASNYFSWEVFSGIQQILYPAGFDFLTLQWSRELRDHDRFLRSIVDRRCEGLIVFPSNSAEDYNYLSTVLEHGTPVVVIDREIPQPSMSFVGSDDIGGAEKITEHLLSLGHERIAYVATPSSEHLSTTKRRYEGYRDFLIKKERFPLDMFILDGENEPNSLLSELLDEFIREKNITAICANNDLVAADIITSAKSLDIKIPSQLSVAGFGDFPVGRYITPQMTTVRQDPERMGKMAAEILLSKILSKRKDSQIVPVREILPVDLIKRKSTARCPKT